MESYRSFLRSVFWRKLRTDCFKRDHFKCHYCGSSRRLQAHHTLYTQDWYQTTLDHLITLCEFCHKKEHKIGGARKLDSATKKRNRWKKKFFRNKARFDWSF